MAIFTLYGFTHGIVRDVGTATRVTAMAIRVTMATRQCKKSVQSGNGDHQHDNIDDGNNGADCIQHRGSDYLQQHVITALLNDYPKQSLTQT